MITIADWSVIIDLPVGGGISVSIQVGISDLVWRGLVAYTLGDMCAAPLICPA